MNEWTINSHANIYLQYENNNKNNDNNMVHIDNNIIHIICLLIAFFMLTSKWLILHVIVIIINYV